MSQNRTTRTAQRNAGGPDMRIIGIAIALLVAVVVVAVLVMGGSDDTDDVTAGGDAGAPTEEFGAVSTSGAPLPPLPESGDDPAVGSAAPALTSERPGETAEVEPGTEPMMLVFLAHWCPHCQAELPKLVDMADDGAFDDIRTVAVLTSSDPEAPNFPPSAWLDTEGWDGDRFFDDRDSTAAAAYGVTSFPYTVFVDADGEVTQRFAGGQPDERIRSAVDEIAP